MPCSNQHLYRKLHNLIFHIYFPVFSWNLNVILPEQTVIREFIGCSLPRLRAVRITRFTATVTVKLGSLRLRYLTKNYYLWIRKISGNGAITQTVATWPLTTVKTHEVNQRIHQYFFCIWNLHLLNYIVGSADKCHLSLPTGCHIKLGWLTDCSQLRFRGGGVTVNRLHAQSTIIGVIVKYSSHANPAMYSEFKTLEGQ